MATTADYLTQLQKDKQTLVDNLVSKGVNASSDETFTFLVPKVAEIKSGSSEVKLEDLTITPTEEQQIFNHPESDGYNVVTVGAIKLQTKEVTPTKESQEVVSEEEYNGLKNVLVNPIPDEYIIPTGTLEVTENGEYDVLEKEKVNVSVDNINEYIITESYSNNDIIRRIKKLPMVDLSGSTSMNAMCSTMHALLEVPALDTSSITNATSAFSNCSRLLKIALLDFSNVNAISGLLSNDRALTTLGGFKDLGQAYSTSVSANYSSYTLDLSTCTSLTHESLMNVINNLYDIASAGVQTQKLVLGSTNLAKLTEEEIAIATNKGWSVS